MKQITRRDFIGKAGMTSMAACSSSLLLAAPASTGKVAVLDDFETAESLKKWNGKVTLSHEHPGHGR